MAKKEKPIVKRDIVTVKRSNALIEAKYKSNLLLKKLAVLAISKLTKENMETENGLIRVRIGVNEIRQSLQIKSESIYNTLNLLTKEALKQNVFIEKPNNAGFTGFTIIDYVDYDNQKLEVGFNPEIKKHTTNIEKRYTVIPLETLLSFKSSNTYRVYELLRVFFHRIPDNGVFEFEIPWMELKFSLGLVNLDNKKVVRDLERGVPYEEILDKIPKDEHQYHTWGDFSRRVLKTAKEELDKSEKSEISFEYEGVSGENGKRIVNVRFWVRKKILTEQNTYILDEKDDEIISAIQVELFTEKDVNEIYAFCKREIEKDDVRTILKKANGNTEKIKELYVLSLEEDEDENPAVWITDQLAAGRKTSADELAQPLSQIPKSAITSLYDYARGRIGKKGCRSILEAAQSNLDLAKRVVEVALSDNKIENPVGWAIEALRNEWDIQPKTTDTAAIKKKNAFHNFTERDNDYDEIQRELVKAQRQRRAKEKDQEKEGALVTDESGQTILPGIDPEDIKEPDNADMAGIEEMARLFKAMPEDMRRKLAESLKNITE